MQTRQMQERRQSVRSVDAQLQFRRVPDAVRRSRSDFRDFSGCRRHEAIFVAKLPAGKRLGLNRVSDHKLRDSTVSNSSWSNGSGLPFMLLA